MKTVIIATLFLMSSSILLAQETDISSGFSINDEVKIDNAPRLYSSYFSEFKINQNWKFKSEYIRINSPEHTLFEFPLLLKYNLGNDFNVLFGVKPSLLRDNTNGQIQKIILHSVIGIDKEITKNFLLEARFNYRVLGESLPDNFYSSGSRSSYKFGGKVKF